MDIAFEKLLSLSLQAGIISLVVLVLRFLLKKAPKKLICSLWLLVALRLLVPFSFESRVSLMPEPPLPEILTQSEIPEAPSAWEPVMQEHAGSDPVQAPVPVMPGPMPEAKPDHTIDTLTLLELIWALGVLTMVIYGSISYGKLRRKVAPAIEVRKGIYFCDYIESPFVMGVLHPRIYLPSTIAQEDIPYILAHERAHIRRLDPLWKQIGFLLLTLHWFNPLLWLAFILFCRDIEGACDEKVIAGMGVQAKVPYSNALLSCSLPRGRIYPLAFGEIGVKQRIKAVLSYRKPTLWITIAAILALIVTGVCLLTKRPGNSLSELYKFPEAQAITVMGNYKAYDMVSVRERSAVEDLLKDLQYDSQPLETPPDPAAMGTLSLFTGSLEDRTGLFFTPDGSQVAIGSPKAIEAAYTVKNPKKVTAFFADWLQPVAHQEVSGSPNWEEGAPWAWANTLDISQLARLKLYIQISKQSEDGVGGSSTQSGIYNMQNAEPLLKLLHDLKEADFLKAHTWDRVQFSDLWTPTKPETPCTLLCFYDGVNRKVIAIRQQETDVDFCVSDDYDAILNQDPHSVSFQHWKLQNEEMLHYLQSLQENSPIISTFVGWEHDWDIPREMAYGDAHITMPVIKGWDVEEVPYRDDHTSWGFRVRPKDQEGSLFFGFWPQGFAMQEENRYYYESGNFGFDCTTTSYPASVVSPDGSLDTRGAVWSYQLFEGDIGDYAIVNEGADGWFHTYEDAIDDICMLTNFRGQLPEDQPKTQKGPDLSLLQNAMNPEALEDPVMILASITPEIHKETLPLDGQPLEIFLSVFDSLHGEDIQDMNYGQRQTLQDLMELENGQESAAAILLPLRDQELILVIVSKYQPEIDQNILRFYTTEEYAELMQDPSARVPFQEYYLNFHGEGLLDAAILRLNAQIRGQQWGEPMTIGHDKAVLTVPTIPSWEYEEVPYTDENTPFGVRIHPKGEEGWLFVSFCPQGLSKEAAEAVPRHEIYGPEYDAFGGHVSEYYTEDDYDPQGNLKPESSWDYRLYRCSFGDYVIFNQDADSWFSSHREEIEDILLLCAFQGDPIMN